MKRRGRPIKKLKFDPSTTQRKFLEATERIVFFGGGAGGGKTWAILVDNLQGVHDPAYFSVFFRTTTIEIDKGLWPEAKLMYEPILKDENGKYRGKAHINEQTKTITFPSGARTTFSYLEYGKHADSWYGSEITKIYFDEFQFRTEYQFDILRSRNRSRAKVQKGIRCTLNPDDTHFVYDWVKPFLDEEGFPIPELGGRTRYYLIVDGKLITDWDREVLKAKYNKNPQTYTYIPSLLEQNKYLMENDPEYMDNLDSMPERKRKQLLLGCWKSDDDSGMYFKRTWLKEATHVPMGCKPVRAYDLAASEPTKDNPKPDYTASIMMWKSREGYFYITGNHIPEFKDPDSDIVGRFRKRSGDRDLHMLAQAKHDGSEVPLVIPEDSGAAGKEAFLSKVRYFTGEGFKVIKDASVQNHSKLAKFEPFATAAEHGLVYIVKSSFANEESLEWYLSEMERFDGEKSTKLKKDEAIDITASAYNTLAKARVVNLVRRNQNNSPTAAAERLSKTDPLAT